MPDIQGAVGAAASAPGQVIRGLRVAPLAWLLFGLVVGLSFVRALRNPGGVAGRLYAWVPGLNTALGLPPAYRRGDDKAGG